MLSGDNRYFHIRYFRVYVLQGIGSFEQWDPANAMQETLVCRTLQDETMKWCLLIMSRKYPLFIPVFPACFCICLTYEVSMDKPSGSDRCSACKASCGSGSCQSTCPCCTMYSQRQSPCSQQNPDLSRIFSVPIRSTMQEWEQFHYAYVVS